MCLDSVLCTRTERPETKGGEHSRSQTTSSWGRAGLQCQGYISPLPCTSCTWLLQATLACSEPTLCNTGASGAVCHRPSPSLPVADSSLLNLLTETDRERSTDLLFPSLADYCMSPHWGSNPQSWHIWVTFHATWPGLLFTFFCLLWHLGPSWPQRWLVRVGGANSPAGSASQVDTSGTFCMLLWGPNRHEPLLRQYSW